MWIFGQIMHFCKSVKKALKCAKSIEINLLTRLNLCMSPPRVALSSELHLATTFFTYTIPDSTRICNSILLSNEEQFLSYDKSSRGHKNNNRLVSFKKFHLDCSFLRFTKNKQCLKILRNVSHHHHLNFNF